jgi:hypothetical protein
MICYCLVIGFAMGLRVYIGYVNRQRDSQKAVRDEEAQATEFLETEDDATDSKTWSFRY